MGSLVQVQPGERTRAAAMRLSWFRAGPPACTNFAATP